MSRFRLVLLSMLAVMAVAGVASASASAHQYILCPNVGSGSGVFPTNKCETPGGSKEYVRAYPGPNGLLQLCLPGTVVGGKNYHEPSCISTVTPLEYHLEESILYPNPKVTGTSGESILKSELSGVAITIKCKKDKFAGTLGAEGKSSATTITYEECKLTGSFESKCEVEETLKTNTLKDELTGTRVEDRFEPESGNFIEIVIKAKSGKTCSIASTYPITGNQKCEADKSNTEAMTLKEEHELICKASGSSLKLGPEPATYEGTATVKLEGGGNWAIE